MTQVPNKFYSEALFNESQETNYTEPLFQRMIILGIIKTKTGTVNIGAPF